jgi:hypothetical protein
MKNYKFLFVTALTRELSNEYGEDLASHREQFSPSNSDFYDYYESLLRRGL